MTGRTAEGLHGARVCNAPRVGPNIAGKTTRGEDEKVADAHEHSGEVETRGQDVDGSGDESLEAAARDERELARERLGAELGREPSDEEVDKWLSEQTEGY